MSRPRWEKGISSDPSWTLFTTDHTSARRCHARVMDHSGPTFGTPRRMTISTAFHSQFHCALSCLRG
eukprot:8763583-Pyramimonas_sp.AAC.1